MKVYELQDDFGLDNLVLAERERPDVATDEILVEMQAMSVNYRDVMMIEGSYNPRQPLPLIPFSDGAGKVVEVGDQVTRFETGDRVMPSFIQDWHAGEPTKKKVKTSLGGPLDGTLCEYMAVPAESAVRVPEHLSFEQAATLPCAGLTAWNALFEHGNVRSGDVVVCQGTGGVSMFAMLFAVNVGAEVIQTSSSDAKLEKVRQQGASHTINYRDNPEWGRLVEEMTDGRGADHIVEVGGAGTLGQSLKAVRHGGHISVIGVLSGASQELSVIPILMQNVRVQGLYVGHREMFERMVRAMEVRQLTPPVDRTFDFEDLHAGLEYVKAGKHFGKVVFVR